MNNKTNKSLIKQSNEKISRLIALPLLKKEYPEGNLPDFSLDTIIKIQKTINTRVEKDIARFKKGKKYFIEYSNDLANYFKNSSINNTKEAKIIDLKNFTDNNSDNNSTIPVLTRLSDTIENTIYDDGKKNFNKKFNYSMPSWWGLCHQEETERREIIFTQGNYIKSITTFNTDLAKSTNIVYSFNKKNNILKFKNIYSILHYSFYRMCSAIGKPIFLISHNKIQIQIWFYWTPNITTKFLKSNFYSRFLMKNKNYLTNLAESLSKLLKKPVELEIIRIYNPYLDSKVMVNLFGFVDNFTKYKIIREFIFRVGYNIDATKLKIRKKEMDPIIPSVLTGIKLRLAGRFMNQRFYRRVRNKEIQRGSLTRNNARVVNLARLSGKSKRGAYSVTVTSGYSIID